MIPEKALAVTRRMDRLAAREFGDAYTLKTTFWNDGDFRVVVYSSKDATETPFEGVVKVFVELWYQDSRMQDGDVMKVVTAQNQNVPRDETRQMQVEDAEIIELPD